MDMSKEANLVGGEFIAPNVSPIAKKFILAARALMYSDGMEDALKRAIAGGDYLSDGCVPFIAMIVTSLGRSIKPLTDADAHTIVVHLAGSLVDIAKAQGDPDAADSKAAVADITEGVMLVLSGAAQNAQAQEAPQETMPQEAPLLASANG